MKLEKYYFNENDVSGRSMMHDPILTLPVNEGMLCFYAPTNYITHQKLTD